MDGVRRIKHPSSHRRGPTLGYAPPQRQSNTTAKSLGDRGVGGGRDSPHPTWLPTCIGSILDVGNALFVEEVAIQPFSRTPRGHNMKNIRPDWSREIAVYTGPESPDCGVNVQYSRIPCAISALHGACILRVLDYYWRCFAQDMSQRLLSRRRGTRYCKHYGSSFPTMKCH